MFKKYLALIILGLGSIAIHAQSLSVTATITDSDSTVWANCSISAVINSPNGTPFYNGSAVPITTQTGTCNGSGVIAITLFNTNTITPTGVQYNVTICSNTSAKCSTFLTAITAANQTSNFSSHVTAPRFAAFPGAFGYNDTEVSAKTIGQGYYNVTTPGYEICNGIACVAIAGGGFAYNPAAVAITGGTIDGTVIGGTTPAVVNATSFVTTAAGANTATVQVNGNNGLGGAGGNQVVIVSGGLGVLAINHDNSLIMSASSMHYAINTQDNVTAGGPDMGWGRCAAGTFCVSDGGNNANGTLAAANATLATHPVATVDTASPTANQTACIKSAGPPIQIGTCSSVVGAGGACTCN